jgi:hypothetical protein
MKNYRYDLISAYLDGVKVHPKTVMGKLGKVIKYESCPIADCWAFRMEKEINPLPSFLSELDDDFKFTDERN